MTQEWCPNCFQNVGGLFYIHDSFDRSIFHCGCYYDLDRRQVMYHSSEEMTEYTPVGRIFPITDQLELFPHYPLNEQ